MFIYNDTMQCVFLKCYNLLHLALTINYISLWANFSSKHTLTSGVLNFIFCLVALAALKYFVRLHIL